VKKFKAAANPASLVHGSYPERFGACGAKGNGPESAADFDKRSNIFYHGSVLIGREENAGERELFNKSDVPAGWKGRAGARGEERRESAVRVERGGGKMVEDRKKQISKTRGGISAIPPLSFENPINREIYSGHL
jgi:hypothetical protein